LTEEAQKQTYDNVLKRWFERHVKEIIPLFLEERELARNEDRNAIRQKLRPLDNEQSEIEEMNIEALIPPRRNDRVYRAPYKGKMHIVDVEIETSLNGRMALRSLIYHSLLMEKYCEPILSMILYPFKMPIVKSPLEDTNGDGESIAFRFRTLPLWRFNAYRYFEQRRFCMFALLPAMGGATRNMLFQALDFMVQFYRENLRDETGLREELITFGVLMRRAAILSPAGIEEVTQKMVSYDPFIMEDPHFGALIRAEAEARAEVLAEARAEVLAEARAEVLALAFSKSALIHVIEERFPVLIADIDKAVLPDNPDELGLLMVKIAIASDEKAARQLLGLPAN
jgi:hypothetical protein